MTQLSVVRIAICHEGGCRHGQPRFKALTEDATAMRSPST